jgi:hypothetical protein
MPDTGTAPGELAVVPLPEGGWAVTERVGEPPVSVHSCQALAQVEALRLARPSGARVIVFQRAAPAA